MLPTAPQPAKVISLVRHMYSCLFYLILPGVWLRLLWRSLREPAYRHDPWQRLGGVPARVQASTGQGAKPVAWVHAVSAGETIAAVPLVQRLLASGHEVVMTNMTPTGRERVDALLGAQVRNYYAPYDVPGAVKRFVRRIAPDVLIVMDTELWPNMLHHSHAAGVRVVLANARLSERSALGYGRIAMLTDAMLRDVDVVAVQTKAHGERFLRLGLRVDKLHVAGSVKFDSTPPMDLAARVEDARALLGTGTWVMGASTHAGEEAAILDAFGRLRSEHPDLRLILAPRHSHRATEVMALCGAKGLSVTSRSSGDACTGQTAVFVLDTMGELTYFYGAADIAFVGGSLVPVGGHNFLEAVTAEVPVIMGHCLDNVEDIAVQFVEDNAMVVVRDLEELTSALKTMLSSESYRRQLTENANLVYERNRGALARVERLVMDQLNRRSV